MLLKPQVAKPDRGSDSVYIGMQLRIACLRGTFLPFGMRSTQITHPSLPVATACVEVFNQNVQHGRFNSNIRRRISPPLKFDADRWLRSYYNNY